MYYVYVYIYIYIHRERERETETERKIVVLSDMKLVRTWEVAGDPPRRLYYPVDCRLRDIIMNMIIMIIIIII